MAKEKKLPYIGPFKIIKQNEYVAKIRGEDNCEDWVHKRHLVHVPPRPLQLIPPLFLPATTTKIISSPQSTTTNTTTTTTPTIPVGNNVPRRSGRNRKQTQPLNIASTKGSKY